MKPCPESLAARIELHRLALLGAMHDVGRPDEPIDRDALETTVGLISAGLLNLAFEADRLSHYKVPVTVTAGGAA
jgi:hypothetical protein